MELLYIWIEDYKNIRRQGFNFSAQYRFEFTDLQISKDEKGETVTGGELKVTKNPNYIKNFFGEDITNVTAIVGENGSGKSGLLAYIINTINNPNEYNILFAFSKKTEEAKDFYIFTPNQKLINQISYTDKKGNIALLDKKKYLVHHFAENFKTIYYDNIWDITSFQKFYNANPTEYMQAEFYNISNMGLYYTIFRGVGNRWLNIGVENIDMSSNRYGNDIFLYFYVEYMLQIIFLKDNQEKEVLDIPFSHRGYFDLSVNKNLLGKEYKGHFTNLVDKIYDKQGVKTDLDFIRLEWIAAILLSFCFSNEKGEKHDDSQSLIDLVSKDSNVFEVAKEYINTKSPQYKSVVELGSFSGFKAKEAKELIDYLNKVLIESNIRKNEEEITPLQNYQNLRAEQSSKSPINYQMKLEYGKDLILKYLNHIQFEFGIGNFLHIDFSYFSFGEKAFLSQYAIFYQVNKYLEIITHSDNCIILIDEGELGMHPQWQKKYLQNILTILPQIFKDKKLQFILTSHSPFLVSDLPKDHVIFLEKGEDGTCKVKDSLNEMKQTFGANIHTLLTDSFFMKGGLMGEFAKEKLKNVLMDITDNIDKIGEDRKKEIGQIISMVGEPLLRKKLERLYSEKINPDNFKTVEDLTEEEKRLEERLDKIKEEKKKRAEK